MNELKILVVDDESRMRKLVKDFLTRAGYQVLEAQDGEEAVDTFYSTKGINLLVLDVMMPKMDGWEVVKEIRKVSKVPIIMLTAKDQEQDELLGFELGVDEYISKPMYLYSRQFTKPIEDMAKAANQMSHLDFDVKVPTGSDDELGRLGASINELSSKLEFTISELKTSNNELQKDIEQKVQIDEMRKEFLSHVSHELKTPIALIQGYSEGLKDNILDDEESKEFYCDVIADEAKKMNRMVQKLLTLNQIEFGNNQVNMERFDITEMIRNMVESSKILVEKQEVKIIFDEPETHVWADEFMIEEVVNNYLSNARNHVTDGGIIKVSYCRHGNDVRIKVFNTGDHIPQEDIDKLWVKFYKVDKARTREYGGSGIGLSIVEATMKAHGKDYGVANVEGGVEFYFDVESADSESVQC